MKGPGWFYLRVGALLIGGAGWSAPGHAQLLLATASPAMLAAEAPPAAAMEEEEFEDEYAVTGPQIRDPFERVNRTMLKFNNTVYDRVLKPVVRGYEAVVPGPARRGLSSFFDNVRFPVRFFGSVLQGKVDRAAAETGKFVVNSTVGLAGFIKVSERFPKLRVPEEDFGQAFGVWGIHHGPFLVLPVLGPSSVRELFGRVGDYYATPLNWRFMDRLAWEEKLAVQLTDILVDLPDQVRTAEALRQAAVDPYIAFRNGYVQYRDAEVKR